jgi:hypothetical protein
MTTHEDKSTRFTRVSQFQPQQFHQSLGVLPSGTPFAPKTAPAEEYAEKSLAERGGAESAAGTAKVVKGCGKKRFAFEVEMRNP